METRVIETGRGGAMKFMKGHGDQRHADRGREGSRVMEGHGGPWRVMKTGVMDEIHEGHRDGDHKESWRPEYSVETRVMDDHGGPWRPE